MLAILFVFASYQPVLCLQDTTPNQQTTVEIRVDTEMMSFAIDLRKSWERLKKILRRPGKDGDSRPVTQPEKIDVNDPPQVDPPTGGTPPLSETDKAR